ncbi:methyl-accepting chemotaxis protein [Tropicibacter naphthalenivorans]|nr:methyl-accepting chemotaxis protein [Tropicibacter naphthalenivorans]
MAVTTIVVAGVLSVQSGRLANQLAVKAVGDQAEKSVDALAVELVKPIRFKASDKITEVGQNTLDIAGESGQALLVIDASGAVLSSFGAVDALGGDFADMAAQALAEGHHVAAENGLWQATPVMLSADEPPIGAAVIAYSADVALASVREQNQMILMTAVTVFVVMMAITVLVLKRVLGRPLATMSGALQTVTDGDYDSKVPMVERADEFGAIARNLDQLVTKLHDGRVAEEQRVIQMQLQSRVVDHLGQSLDVLAEGVLNRDIHEEFPENYEQLRHNYNRAVQSLRVVIGEVRDASSDILGNADSIARASDDLSRRTETQAATLEESAAALEELLNSVNTAAQNASNADAAARNARDIARQNGEVMHSAISAMAEIEKSSEQISEIITVIDDIAFQTNLLALNAGVEAARAGESGKGFAVVASEVRGLAQRSAEAAQQIKDLIIGSADQVQNGVQLVEKAGKALEEVVGKVAEISDMVSEIARGAGEQAQGLEEINVGIANLDRVTQQNAAMVEEATAAAHTLRADSGGLRDKVALFQTDSSEPASMAAAAPSRPATAGKAAAS